MICFFNTEKHSLHSVEVVSLKIKLIVLCGEENLCLYVFNIYKAIFNMVKM